MNEIINLSFLHFLFFSMRIKVGVLVFPKNYPSPFSPRLTCLSRNDMMFNIGELPMADNTNENTAPEIPKGRKPINWKLIKIGGIVISAIIIVVLILSLLPGNKKAQGSDFSPESMQATAQAIAMLTLVPGNTDAQSEAGGIPTITPDGTGGGSAAILDALYPFSAAPEGISRSIIMDTTIPSRERVDIITHTVEQGETLFSIAESYDLEPESIVWGNDGNLPDNLVYLSVGTVLNILPVDGVYYKYEKGKTIRQIAEEFDTTPEAILEFTGNGLDPYETDIDQPLLDMGQYLILPGASDEIPEYGPPAITRTNAATAAYYGSGSCGTITSGAVGNGTFIWPTSATTITQGYDAALHAALDIGGGGGEPIYAVDGGVVVYAGWSEYGYGNMVVIDHGTGWQSAYAHLLSYFVSCGQSVSQGTTIGTMGSTGNSTGPHLHIELRSEIYGKVNPLNYLFGP